MIILEELCMKSKRLLKVTIKAAPYVALFNTANEHFFTGEVHFTMYAESIRIPEIVQKDHS